MVDKNTQLVSIIMPVYNSEIYLKRSIESVVNQDYINFELLIIDDGSKDNSLKICHLYAQKDARIKIFVKENGGPASARNYGLSKVIGEYIIFVDSDDALEKNTISKLVAEINNTNSDLVCCGHKKVLEEQKKEIVFMPEILCENVGRVLENISMLMETETIQAPWGKLFKNNIIQKHKIVFPEYLKFGEDTYFVYGYLTYCHKVNVVSEPLYLHYRYEGSLSKRLVEDVIEIYILLYQKLVELMEIHKVNKYTQNVAKSFGDSLIHGMSIVFKYEYKLNKKQKKSQVEKIIDSSFCKEIFENNNCKQIQHKIIKYALNKNKFLVIYYYFDLKEKIRFVKKMIIGG